jgi:hypothetical protein
MSVEQYVLSAIVDEGDPRRAFRAGINKTNFQIYEDEWEWLVRRYEKNKPINRRIFCERFEDFEYIVSKEPVDDLLSELKDEKAYSDVYSLIASASETLLPENAVEQAELMREVLSDVVKTHSPHSEISVKDHAPHFERVRQHRIMAKKGIPFGMPLFIPSLDFNYDGLVWGRLYGVFARPGEGKSMLQAWISWAAIKGGFRVGLFSPEMNEFEHINRMHTLASADPWVQKEVGITKPFKNRDLMRGTGFNLKDYKQFCEFFDSLPGDCQIFTKKFRKTGITPAYIASRVQDLGLQGIIADPLSKISTLKRKENPIWEMQDKVDQFQSLAKEYNVWAIATNWSHRQNKTKDDAPGLDESFGSDALAQEADHVLGLKYDQEESTLLLRCTKSRFGQNKFRVYIDFNPNTGLFEEVDMKQEVVEWKLKQNGSSQNGNSSNGHHKVNKAILKNTIKPKKVQKYVG